MDPKKIARFISQNQKTLDAICSRRLQPGMSPDWKAGVSTELDHMMALKRLRVITFGSVLSHITRCIKKLDREPMKIAWTRNASNIENILALLTVDLLVEKGAAFAGSGKPLLTVDLLDLYEASILAYREKGVVVAAYASAGAIARVEAHGFKVHVQERLLSIKDIRLPPWMPTLKHTLDFEHSAIFDYRPLNQSCALGIYAVVQPSAEGHTVVNPRLFVKGATFAESIRLTLASEVYSLQNILSETLIDPTTGSEVGKKSPFTIFSD